MISAALPTSSGDEPYDPGCRTADRQRQADCHEINCSCCTLLLERYSHAMITKLLADNVASSYIERNTTTTRETYLSKCKLGSTVRELVCPCRGISFRSGREWWPTPHRSVLDLPNFTALFDDRSLHTVYRGGLVESARMEL